MAKKISLKKVNQVLGILKKRGILRLLVVQVTGCKGPVLKRLIPIIIWGTSCSQGKDKGSWIRIFSSLFPSTSCCPPPHLPRQDLLEPQEALAGPLARVQELRLGKKGREDILLSVSP